jgi:glycosyltransferase involved in cell wall biosynthesis
LIAIYKNVNKNNYNKFKISIIIPCRNEEKYISQCIDSLLDNSYPKNLIEIIIIDGMSEDNTREIIKKYIEKYPFIKLINNSKKIVPTALNIGIKKAIGDIIIRIDVHSTYTPNYIKRLVLWSKKSKADNVGGICITKPGAETESAKAIALALSHPFGVGNPYFRIGTKEPKYVDTVPFGCYKREVFDKIGLFDEDLVRNQDDEFNLRLIKNGGKILLVPDIISYYHARDSIYKLWKMYFQYGHFKPLVVKKVGGVLTWRQIIPPSFMGSLILALLLSFFTKFFLWLFLFILGLYTTVNFSLSLIISIKKKDLRLLPFLLILKS